MIDSYVLTDEDVKLINNFTRKKYEKDEIYAFPVVLCDNEIDRDFEKFSDEALKKLSLLYVGKTGIYDHDPKSKNQSARIFKCVFEELNNQKNSLGEIYKRVLAYAYIPKTEENNALINSIDSGIKKEISVSCSVKKKYCSICHSDLTKGLCEHRKGASYNSLICYHILDEPFDAYEWSFVAVPAQKNAGVIKSFIGGDKMENILKKLEFKSDVTLNNNEVLELKEKFKELSDLAQIGKAYKSNLQNDVLKLCEVLEPKINSIIKNHISDISLKELEDLKYYCENKTKDFRTPLPQLFGEKPKSLTNHNTQYNI